MEQRTVEQRKEVKRMKNCVDVEPNRAHDIAAGTLNLSFLFGVLWWILWNFIYNVRGWGAERTIESVGGVVGRSVKMFILLMHDC